MKRFVLFVIMSYLSFAAVFPQDFDSKPAVNIENKKEDLRFTIGARFMADAAYYANPGESVINSGAAITDARIRTSMTYHDWYFYADFDFSRGKFSQKNIFLQYTFHENRGNHLIKAGYYNDPATMANNTSRGSLHFISRAAPVNALSPGRELGLSYIFYNKEFLANQGVFAENKYNDQISGFQGLTLGGRWLWRPVNTGTEVLHIGASFRHAKISTGVKVDGVLRTQLDLGSSLETYTDPAKNFLSVSLPWADHDYYFSGELLYMKNKFFARGEYLFQKKKKKRDDNALFEAQIGNDGAYATIDEWRVANPLSSDTFHGAYVEAGYKILGGGYAYSDVDGVIKGASKEALEVVARYSYLDLDDVLLPDNMRSVSPLLSGNRLHAATVGVNYAFNKYVKLLLSYTYSHLDTDDFNTLQARLMFQF